MAVMVAMAGIARAETATAIKTLLAAGTGINFIKETLT